MILPPIEIDSDEAGNVNVVKLDVPFKKPDPVERVFTIQHKGHCFHTRGYVLDPSLEHIHCKVCDAPLDPMHVLRAMANRETKYHELIERYQSDLARLNERNRCKCEHCGKMTNIEKSR